MKIEIELPDTLHEDISSFVNRFERNLTPSQFLERFLVEGGLMTELDYQKNLSEIKKLITDFKAQIGEWSADNSDIKYVFNEDLENVKWEEINYIIVADNPGKKEKEDNKYLVSEDNKPTSSGYIADKIFEYLKIKNKYIVLNKCPIFTKETGDLKKHKEYLQCTQEYMAELTFNLHSKLNCKVYIFGLGGCYDLEKKWLTTKSNGDYYANQIMPWYFKKIQSLYEIATPNLKNSFFIIKHFSRWNIFSDLVFKSESNSNENINSNIVIGKKVKLSSLKDKKIPPEQLINALESLEYKNELFEG